MFTGAGGTLTPTGFTTAAQPAIIVGAAVVAAAALLALLLPGRTVPAAGAPEHVELARDLDLPLVPNPIAAAL